MGSHAPQHFPGAFEAALAEELKEIEAIAANTDEPTFDNTFAAMERSGSALDRITRMFNVARENVTTPDYQTLEREWQPKLVRRCRCHRVQSRVVQTHRVCVSRSSVHARARPDTTGDTRVRELHAARREAGRGRQDAPVGHQPGARGAVRGVRNEGAGRREHLDVLEDEADLAGLPASLRRNAARRRRRAWPRGAWAVVNTRSSVDPFLTLRRTTRPARDGLERLQEPRRQRRRQRHQRDDRRHRAAPGRARALLGFASHAHWRMPTRWPALRDAPRPLMLRRLARRRRARAPGGRRHAGHRRSRSGGTDDRAVGLPLLRGEGPQGEIRPRSDRAEAVFRAEQHDGGAFWSAERLYGVTFTEIPGTVPVFHPDVRVWEVDRRRHGRHRACSTATTSRAPESGRAPGRRPIASHETMARPVDADRRRTTTTSSRARRASPS